MTRSTMAIDQYGETFHNLGPHPRKTLLERLGRKHAERMYHDTKTGTKHIGYVIGGRWLRVFDVTGWERPA